MFTREDLMEPRRKLEAPGMDPQIVMFLTQLRSNLEKVMALIEPRTQEILGLTPRENKTVLKILALVAEFYGVNIRALSGPSRVAAIAWPRQVAMSLIRESTGLSYQRIGCIFCRTHRTVMHAISTVNGRCEVCSKTLLDVSRLRELIKQTGEED